MNNKYESLNKDAMWFMGKDLKSAVEQNKSVCFMCKYHREDTKKCSKHYIGVFSYIDGGRDMEAYQTYVELNSNGECESFSLDSKLVYHAPPDIEPDTDSLQMMNAYNKRMLRISFGDAEFGDADTIERAVFKTLYEKTKLFAFSFLWFALGAIVCGYVVGAW